MVSERKSLTTKLRALMVPLVPLRALMVSMAELVPLPYSRGRSSCYSNRMHDFSVIPRCYKDVYVNGIFLHSQSLEFFAINALSFDILSKWLYVYS